MKNRILTALAALPILIASVILPAFFPQAAWTNWLFLLVAGLALAAGLFEFYSLTKKLELKADAAIAYLGATAFFIAFLFDAPTKFPDLLILTVALFIIAVLVTQTFRFQVDFSKMLAGIGATLLGVFYVAFLGGFLVSIRTGFDSILSTHLLSFFFLVIMGADTGAYFTGKYFGKHKLAPKISPGKTVEGLIGGIAASLAFAALAHLWFFRELDLKFALSLAIVMTAASVLGDLAESAMKRGAGAKDAANLLPGHGGILDRLDSLLFNAPILYYFARFYF
ncbi:MAG: phosphatidate cytidylyltransferase [Pyrinomonadaceae bacterium]